MLLPVSLRVFQPPREIKAIIIVVSVCVTMSELTELSPEKCAQVNWSGFRVDLLGATENVVTCDLFVKRLFWVLDAVKNTVPEVEWDSSVRTPSAIMSLISDMIYPCKVADVSAHIAKIVALATQMQSAVNSAEKSSQ